MLGDFVVEDGKFELRMGATAYFGYEADQRIPTIPGLIEIVMGPIQVGDTVVFGRCRQSGSRSTKMHHMTVEKLGIDHNLDDGRWGSDPPGGAVGDSDDPNNNCVFGPFTEPGEYIIDDSTDPGGHGVAKFVVEGEAMDARDVVAAEPVTYTVSTISVEDNLFDLRLGADAYWGYDAGSRNRSNEADVVLTFNVGDTLIVETIRMSGSRSSTPHRFTVVGLGIDINLDAAAGGAAQAPWEYTFTKSGRFPVTDSLHADDAHGSMTFVVTGRAIGPQPPPTRETAAREPPDGLVNWWPGDGSAEDLVGGSNGSLLKGASFATGKVDRAFSFDGVDDAVALATQPKISEALTISAWVNFDRNNFGNFQEVFNNNQFFLRKDSSPEGNKFSLFVKLTDGSVRPRAQSITIPNPGAWYQVTGTWDGTTARIYVNGVAEGSSQRRGRLTSTVVGPRIGQGEQTSVSGNTFSGRIDELMIYNRALSADEIKAIYDAGSSGLIKPTRPAIQLASREWAALEGDLIVTSYFLVEDGRFELRHFGGQFGHPSGGTVSSVVPGGIVMTVKVGDTIQFRSGLRPGRSTKPHFFTVEGLDIDISVASRRFQPFEITFTKPGEFVIDDSSDPGEHGEAKFVVTGEAISVPLNPSAIAVGDSGRIYVLDDFRVRVLSSQGGALDEWGASGRDSGEFRRPRGIAVDRDGDVYVADTENDRIQVFRPRGRFTLPSLLAVWGSHGTEQGQFRSPGGIAVDGARKVYVADTLNSRVQVFSSTGAFLASWGSDGSLDGQFRRPQGIAVDQAGNIYVSDTRNDRVQVLSPSGAFSHKWGSEGRADGQFRNPEGIAVGSDGNVYVADTGNDRIQIFSPDGEFLGGLALPPGIGDGQFDRPVDIALSKTGTVYVADSGHGRMQVFDHALDTGLALAPKPAPPPLQAVFVTKWGRSPGIGDGRFNLPKGIAVGPLGDVYVADTGNKRVQILDAAGGFQGIPVEKLEFGPTDIGVDPLGNIYLADVPNRQSRVFNARGEPLATWDDIALPGGIAVDASGNVYVTDLSRHYVNKYSPDGESLAMWGVEGNGEGELQNPRGIALDTEGNVYVVDAGNDRVQVFTPTGEFLAQWGTPGTHEGRFNNPTGIAVDGSGRVYVVDTSNHRVQVFTGRGTFLGQWGGKEGKGDGEFSKPSGIAIDDSGAVYVADTRNHRIQVFSVESSAP